MVTANTVDILAALFFVVAGAWLMIALMYSLLVLMFLRMQSRGELMNIYNHDFGHVYLFRCCIRRFFPRNNNNNNDDDDDDDNTNNHQQQYTGTLGFLDRLYVPLGCIFRRYIEHLQRERARTQARQNKYMSPQERRRAMQTLLQVQQPNNNKQSQPAAESSDTSPAEGAAPAEAKADAEQDQDVEQGPTSEATNTDDSDAQSAATLGTQGPVCSICLSEFDNSTTFNDKELDKSPKDSTNQQQSNLDVVLQSKTCSHRFHASCVLDWLERPGTVECPCCRVPMVKEDDVWKTVVQHRKIQKREIAKQRRRRRIEQNIRQKKLAAANAAASSTANNSTTGGANGHHHSNDDDDNNSIHHHDALSHPRHHSKDNHRPLQESAPNREPYDISETEQWDGYDYDDDDDDASYSERDYDLEGQCIGVGTFALEAATTSPTTDDDDDDDGGYDERSSRR